MRNRQETSRTVTRRNTLWNMAGVVAATMVPGSLLAAGGESLDVYAAECAKALAKGRNVKLRLLLPEGSGANIGPIARAFAERTGIQIIQVETPVDQINSQLALDSMSGEGAYDVALPATFGLPDLVAANAIIPLTEYANRHEPVGFRDNILYSTGDNFDQEIYGFQADGDAYVMFYHKEFLEDPREKATYEDRFGAPLTVPQTWQDLDRQIAFFHRPDEDKYGGLLFRTPSFVAWEWWIRFHAKGVWPLSPDLEPQFTSDAGVEALEELIRVTEYLPTETRNMGLFDNWARYDKGNVFCNIGWGGTQKYLNKPDANMRGRMVFGPTPGGIIDGELLLTPYFNWGWNYVVTSQSPIPEIAYLFALFASTSEMSTLSIQQQDGFFDPFLPEHYKDARIREIYSPEFLDVHYHSMVGAIPDLYLADRGEYFRILSVWLSRALDKTVAAEEALKRIGQHWSLINQRGDKQTQRARWAALRAKYPQSVRMRLQDLPIR